MDGVRGLHASRVGPINHPAGWARCTALDMVLAAGCATVLVLAAILAGELTRMHAHGISDPAVIAAQP